MSPVTSVFPINNGSFQEQSFPPGFQLPIAGFTQVCQSVSKSVPADPSTVLGHIRVNISLSSRTSFNIAQGHTPLGFGSVNDATRSLGSLEFLNPKILRQPAVRRCLSGAEFERKTWDDTYQVSPSGIQTDIWDCRGLCFLFYFGF